MTLILLRVFVFGTYSVREADQNSYLNTGDYLLLVKEEQPDYNDFVLYEANGQTLVGRVVALGGDHLVSFEDVLYRNHEVVDQSFLEPLKTSYAKQHGQDVLFTEDFDLDIIMDKKGSTVPQDNIFILNDDRQNQADSRQFGLIPRSKIHGVLTFRLYPFQNFGFLPIDGTN